MTRVICFTAGHQFPGDPGELVGKGDRDELRWFALQKPLEPGPVAPPASTHKSDHSCGADDQHAAQGLVASFRDRSRPVLFARRMISRCQPDPGRKMPGRLEAGGIRCLESEHRCSDRTDARNLRQTLR